MIRISPNPQVLFLSIITLLLTGDAAPLCAQKISVEPAQVADRKQFHAESRSRVNFSDGRALEVDDVWEDAQGIWYRSGGVTNFAERSRIKAIERRAKETTIVDEKVIAKIIDVKTTQSNVPAQPIWIYLVGGARFEVDELTENPAGVWYRRGSLSIFLERARIERIEREPLQAATVTASARSHAALVWSTGNAKLDGLIKQNGARFNVDPYLIFCVMEQESHFNPRVVSPKGARGLMQLMPGTSARFGVRRPFDPAQNIMGGTIYLKQLLQNFGGRVDLVLASYNAGEGAVMKYGGRVPPYRETRNYVKRISARYGQSDAASTVRGSVAESRVRNDEVAGRNK